MNPEPIDALHSYDLVSFLTSLIKAVYNSSADQDWSGTLHNFWLLLPDFAVAIMFRLFSFSFFLSLVLVLFIIYTSRKILIHRQKLFDALILPNAVETTTEEAPAAIVNEKWQSVIKHINSPNPNDWKLAILECDIMLGDILEKMGYLQPSIGEKLKSIEPSDFTNIESAWEAHKIRNAIAHEGSDFVINEREAKRVIGLYEVVFNEFKFI